MVGACLDEGAGLLPPEMQHFFSRLPADVSTQGPGNTIGRRNASSSEESMEQQSYSIADFRTLVPDASGPPVVFLDFLPALDPQPLQTAKLLAQQLRTCWALSL